MQILPAVPWASPTAGWVVAMCLALRQSEGNGRQVRANFRGCSVTVAGEEAGEIGCLCSGVWKMWSISRAQPHWPLYQ